MMTREQREKANRLVETLLDVAPDRRAAMLDTIVPGIGEDGPTIRGEVERLLEEDQSLANRLATLLPTGATPADAAPPAALAAHDRVPSVIGRYHLRGPLGGGGMGVVYLAEQRAPIVRTVAIKLIRAGFDTHEVLARFDAERQALARMDHPHIASVFDAGITDGGRPYFVMEYVPGEAITEFADQRRMSIRERLELFVQVCDAISHAHMKGVIHRDLKPSNVLVFERDDGKPIVKVIDFGIAKAMTPGDRLGAKTNYTLPNLVLGTYEYMSPEQAAGLGDIDTRSDVYSLGVLLYELLGGVRPFERDELATHTDEELRRVIRDVEPPRPSTRLLTLLRPKTITTSKTKLGEQEDREASASKIADARRSESRALARLLQRELEWIPLMAMRKERTRRYRGATELAADVRNWLAGKPLVAAPESRWYRARKFVIGHRRAIIAIAAALLLLIAGVIGTSVGLVRESHARQLADANGQLASRAAYRSAIAAADVALRNSDGVSFRWALDSAPAALRGWEWDWLRRSGSGTTIEMHRQAGERFGYSIPLPDNRRAWSEMLNAEVWQLWDLTTGQPLRREAGRALAVSPDGKDFVIVRPDGAIELADVESGVAHWRLPARPTDAARWRLSGLPFSAAGKSIVAWDGSDALTIIDAASGAARRCATGSQPDVIYGFVDFNDDSGSDDHSVVFRTEQALVRRTLDIRTGTITQAPHFDYLAGRVLLTNTGRDQLRSLGPHPVTYNVPQREQALLKAVLPAMGAIATGDANGSVVFRTTQPEVRGEERVSAVAATPRRLIVGDTPAIWLAATSDEKLLIATTADGGVHVCPLDQPEHAAAPMTGGRASAMSPDGTQIAAVSWGDIRCFDVVTGLPVWGRNLGPFENQYIAWSPDGTTIVVATGPLPLDDSQAPDAMPAHEFFVLDAKTGAQRAAFSGSPVSVDAAHPSRPPVWARGIRGMSFSADSKHLLVSRLGLTPAVVDVDTWQSADVPIPANPIGKLLRDRPGSPGTLLRSPSGRRFAEMQGGTVDFGPKVDGGITLRDAATLAPQRTLQLDHASATAVAWAPDEKTLVAGFARADAAFVIAYNVADGRERYRIATPDAQPVSAITCTADGSRVIVFTESRRMLVIDAASGEELLVSSMNQLVRFAAMTADAALITSDDANAFVRMESREGEQLLPSVKARWPGELDQPTSVAMARRAVGKAMKVVVDEYLNGQDPSTPTIAATIEPDAAARKLLVAYATRMPANLNWLNSGALSICLADNPSRESLGQAAAMLRMAVAMKPQSSVLQNNLGLALFRLEDFAAAREPLRASMRIRREHDYPVDARSAISLAIAAKRCGDADAEILHEQAIQSVVGDEEGDPEVKRLLDRMRSEFAAPAN